MAVTSTRYHQGMSLLGPRATKLLTRPKHPPRFQMTPRDELLLEALALYRYCAIEQLAVYAGGSIRGVRTRLYLLWANNYIDRPQSQLASLETYYHHGHAPTIYGLGRKGAGHLKQRGMSLEHRLDKTFRAGKPITLPHTLDVAGDMLRLRAEIAALDCLELVDHYDLLPAFPEATRKSRKPFEIAVTTAPDGKTERFASSPDRVFSLIHNQSSRYNFMLERDRDTESVRPKKMSAHATIFKKQFVYAEAFFKDLYRTQWGFQRLRVLFLTTTESHLDAMIASQMEATQNRVSGMFLYSTAERITAHGMLGPAWRSVTADSLSLLPTTVSLTTIPEQV